MKRPSASHLQLVAALGLALTILLPAPTAALDPGHPGDETVADSGSLAPHVADAPTSATAPLEESPPPDIEVWYGLDQHFGNPGKPQRWINILGNASDDSGIKSLVYSINGGNSVPLTVGPDGFRLVDTGDFNADPDFAEFWDGSNEVVITAEGKDGQTSSVTVSVEVDKGKTWPLPYAVDWDGVSDLQSVAQIVDGLWEIQNGQIHTVRTGYDRLVAIGDTTWTDYEVTVPVVIHEFFAGKKGVGILVRWNGHGDDKRQPHYDHPLGGLGWYRYTDFGEDRGGWLEIWGNGGDIIDEDKDVDLALNTPYIFKMQAETLPNDTSVYRLKVWKASDSEPGEWSLSGPGNIPDVAHGSILLIAHHADASFGPVSITPLRDDCYSLTPVVDPGGSGTIEVDPAPNCGSSQYTPGTEVELTAKPSAGYHFASWSGDASGTTNPTTVTMDGDRSVTANFGQECFGLTTTVEPGVGGTIAVDPGPNCGDKYTAGTQVTLTAEPAVGYEFDHWSGDAIGDSNPKTITLVGDTSVTAHFAAECYSLTTAIAPAGGGTIEADPGPNCDSKYAAGTQVTLTADPASGYHFSHWGGAASGDANPKTVTMTGDVTVTAHFSDECFSLTTSVDPGGGGTIAVDPAPNCGDKYTAGIQVELTAQPASGYRFSHWGGAATGDTNPKTITMTGDASVTAHFTDDCFSLTTSVDPDGGGTIAVDPAPDCGGKYSAGTQVELTAESEAGYEFDHWSGDVSGNQGPTAVTMDGDKSVTAHFVAQCFALSTSSEPAVAGMIVADTQPNCGSGRYRAGTTLTLTATSIDTFQFQAWHGTLSGTDNPIDLTVDSDVQAIAYFEVIPSAFWPLYVPLVLH